MNNNVEEIMGLIQLIEDTKQELADAEYKVLVYPKIIDNLEIKLFEKLKEEAMFL